MLTRKQKHFLLKIASLFSVVRVYNILFIIVAQYLASIFILAREHQALHVIFDYKLFILVLASSLSIASGYIINNFYDSKKDLINRPRKSMIDRLVSQKTKLYTYFSINFFVVFIAFFISFNAFLFYAVYIFLIWFYSHKLKKIVIIGNLWAALLAVLPFFGILMYYKNFSGNIFFHAFYLYLLVLIRELIKDLENIKGDLANNYITIPIKYSEQISKYCIMFLSTLSIVPIYFLIDVFYVGYMEIYFYLSLIVLIYINLKIDKANTKEDYLRLHFILKLLMIGGVLGIVLINPKVVGI